MNYNYKFMRTGNHGVLQKKITLFQKPQGNAYAAEAETAGLRKESAKQRGTNV